jgi:hypothetical protein
MASFPHYASSTVGKRQFHSSILKPFLLPMGSLAFQALKKKDVKCLSAKSHIFWIWLKNTQNILTFCEF